MTGAPARGPAESRIKRGIDLVVGGAALIAATPLMLALGAAIRLTSPGPALLAQERVGLGGRRFTMYKLRTMYAGAPIAFNADGSTRVGDADPRVTPVGRFLRKGLDELPQLYNVARGDMSLVGPRPDLPVHLEAYTPHERRKLRARPGMTSLAAVLGRNAIPWKTRIAIDLAYIDHWSLGLDAKIALDTLGLVLLPNPLASLHGRFFDYGGITSSIGAQTPRKPNDNGQGVRPVLGTVD